MGNGPAVVMKHCCEIVEAPGPSAQVNQSLPRHDRKIITTSWSPNTKLNNFAWFLATCPDDSQRNGKLAVTYATKACELSEWKQANFIGTLAAAYAEVGDFDAAMKYQKQAMDIGSDYPDKQLMEKALKLFQKRKPYRE